MELEIQKKKKKKKERKRPQIWREKEEGGRVFCPAWWNPWLSLELKKCEGRKERSGFGHLCGRSRKKLKGV